MSGRPDWQILIPTIVTRRHWLARLMGHLKPQLVDGVEVVTLEDNGDRSIGAKRDQMVREATGRYVCFFDDDDLPAPDYVSRILPVLMTEDPPDVVGFRLRYFENEKPKALAVHSYNARAILVQLPERGMSRYDRLPNHLNPVRLEIAQALGFRDENCGEDGDYAKRMAQLRPRPRELFIDAYVYDYLYRQPKTRAGEVTNELRTGRRKR